nr:photosystem I assembly protein Ycf4 [Ostreobium quekettii]UXE31234.1 photosystem I assembly protein Ycf4 [Ostreobium quekettii]
MQNRSIRRYNVIGSRRISNYIWAFFIFLGSIGFLTTGFSSYFNLNFLFIFNSKNIIFFPQGLIMCFYGFLGLIFSVYLCLTIVWSVGGGFNEFNKIEGVVRIFRWGFPGKNRRILLEYNLNQIESIKIELKQGLNPRRMIYLQVRGKKEIPLTRVGQPLTLEEIELQAAELAKFLQVSLLMNQS